MIELSWHLVAVMRGHVDAIACTAANAAHGDGSEQPSGARASASRLPSAARNDAQAERDDAPTREARILPPPRKTFPELSIATPIRADFVCHSLPGMFRRVD